MPHLFKREGGHQRRFSTSRENARADAIKLDEVETEDLKYLRENVSDPNKPAKIKWTSKTLICRYGSDKVYKYSENCPIYKKVCEDSNAPHTALWAEALKDTGNLYRKIIAADGMEVSVYDHYVNDYIQEKYEEELAKYDEVIAANPSSNPDPSAYLFWLQEGCKHKGLWALRDSCEEEIFNIQKSASASEEHAYYDRFEENIVLMTKFYGTMGYMCAARLCYDMANYFHKESSTEIAVKYYKMAAEYLFCATNLLDRKLPDDLELVNLIGKANGLMVFGFESLESAENEILSKILSLSIDMQGSEEGFDVQPLSNDKEINKRETQMLETIKEYYVDNAGPIIANEIESREARKRADILLHQTGNKASAESNAKDSTYTP